VRRHLNLTEVTLGAGCSATLSRGVVRGMLQKIGVQKVDVVNSLVLDQVIYSKTSGAARPECECVCVCMHVSLHAEAGLMLTPVCVCVCSSAATVDMVQEFLVPAMKSGSLKTLSVMLEKSSSVESILKELPHSSIEELTIVMDRHFHYSEAVRPP